MPTIHALPVAATVAGTPRFSSTFNYNGTSDVSVSVVLVCPTWASADPAQTVTIEVQQSFDSGSTWAPFATMNAHGSRVGRTGTMPQMTCQCVDDLGPRQVRLSISVDIGSLAVGVDLIT